MQEASRRTYNREHCAPDNQAGERRQTPMSWPPDDILVRPELVRHLHLVALVLVAFYLMIPPLGADGLSIDTKAPLSTWYNMKPSFDSNQECEATKGRMIALHPHPSDPAEQLRHDGAKAAVCVPSDDPRLKGS
jgi:hypothetical protein